MKKLLTTLLMLTCVLGLTACGQEAKPKFHYDEMSMLQVAGNSLEIINGVSNYIKANLDKKITIDDISNSVFLSKSYLQHLFKQYYGIPVSEYVFIQKMHVAQHMLENGASLAETASALGYKYYSSFCMNYKKYFGIPPKSHHSLNT